MTDGAAAGGGAAEIAAGAVAAPIALPDYWWSRPAAALGAAGRAACDAALDSALARGPGALVEPPEGVPAWQLLCHLAEARGFALHGSQETDIEEFEPRQPVDLNDFGAQRAVYAAADGIWPMYFAIVDRRRHPTSIVNACIRLQAPGGPVSQPYYSFSVGSHVIASRPYAPGVVYVLPRDTFAAEPPFPFGGVVVHSAQLASPLPVRPLARVAVAPEDFPFLDRMLSHDESRLADYARAMQQGLPWPNEPAG